MGARPYRPPDVDSASAGLYSEMLLDLSFTPHSITIYGAGVVGCGMPMFRNLGTKVNLVNTCGNC